MSKVESVTYSVVVFLLSGLILKLIVPAMFETVAHIIGAIEKITILI